MNWQELFYVVFAETSAQVRLSYFNVNSDNWSLFYGPLIIGITLAVIYPWINLVSGQLAKIPLRAIKRMQTDEEHGRQIHALENAALIEEAKAELENENERRLLGAAKRLKEAEEISPDAVDELKEGRKSSQNLTASSEENFDKTARSLGRFEQKILDGLSKDPRGHGAIFYQDKDGEPSDEIIFKFAEGNEATFLRIGRHRRDKLKFLKAIDNLLKLGFVEKSELQSDEFKEYRITELGYSAYDSIEIPF